MIRSRRIYRSLWLLALCAAAACFLAGSCRKEEPPEVFFEEDELLISAYLEEHADEYASLISVLELTNLRSTLNAYGHYTFFAPDDDAFAAFCDRHGKASVEDFEVDYLTTLVKYHLLNMEIESSYFRDGVIQDTTFSGDYLVVTFSEGGLETIMVNDATITRRDIHVENGIIHRIDEVLEPIVGSVVDRLGELGGYSIFHEALQLTGLADSLDMITIGLGKDLFIRSRFTLFVESDATYGEHGITGAGDLVSRYSDTGDPADRQDGLHRYMAYHVVPGLHYLNEIDSFNYPTLAENLLINVKLDEEVYLNRHAGEGQTGEEFIRVIEEESNQSAKNGAIHVIDRIMEPYEPDPVYTVIDLTDYQGISLGQQYTERELEDIRGVRTKHTGLYFRNSILADGETNLQTTTDRVGWIVEFDLPPIIRGRYDIHFHWASYQTNTGWAQAFWDGARLGSTFSFVHHKRWPGVEWLYNYNTEQYLGRLILTETQPHRIKFVSLENGYGNFDYLVLRPVENE